MLIDLSDHSGPNPAFHRVLAICPPQLGGALLTQAYRGVGLFSAPLPVRIISVYPSWDRFVFMIHPRTGIPWERGAGWDRFTHGAQERQHSDGWYREHGQKG